MNRRLKLYVNGSLIKTRSSLEYISEREEFIIIVIGKYLSNGKPKDFGTSNFESRESCKFISIYCS